jgi:hypothetical protein
MREFYLVLFSFLSEIDCQEQKHYCSGEITRTLILLLLSYIGYCSPYSISYSFFVLFVKLLYTSGN